MEDQLHGTKKSPRPFLKLCVFGDVDVLITLEKNNVMNRKILNWLPSNLFSGSSLQHWSLLSLVLTVTSVSVRTSLKDRQTDLTVPCITNVNHVCPLRTMNVAKPATHYDISSTMSRCPANAKPIIYHLQPHYGGKKKKEKRRQFHRLR